MHVHDMFERRNGVGVSALGRSRLVFLKIMNQKKFEWDQRKDACKPQPPTLTSQRSYVTLKIPSPVGLLEIFLQDNEYVWKTSDLEDVTGIRFNLWYSLGSWNHRNLQKGKQLLQTRSSEKASEFKLKSFKTVTALTSTSSAKDQCASDSALLLI